MTTLISWISVDSRGPSAINIVSDSRITWGSDKYRWDTGRKVFSCSPNDIFGYCGDVLFPSLVLGQLTDLIRDELLWEEDCSADKKHSIIFDFLKSSFEHRHNAPDRDFSIIHCSKENRVMQSTFHMWHTSFHRNTGEWNDNSINVNDCQNSKLLLALGSGKKSVQDSVNKWENSSQGGTARAVFSAFCDSLFDGNDPLSGGMPQIVSIDRSKGARVIGFVLNGNRFIYGLPQNPMSSHSKIEWVDRLFQRTCPKTGKLLSGAQRHVRPKTAQKGGFARFMRKKRN